MCKMYEVHPECDKRFTAIEVGLIALKKSLTSVKRALTIQGKAIKRIDSKVHNGFGISIDNISERVTNIEKRNDSDHLEIKQDVRAIRNWLITGLILIVVGFVSSGVIQSQSKHIYVDNPTSTVEEVSDDTVSN